MKFKFGFIEISFRLSDLIGWFCLIVFFVTSVWCIFTPFIDLKVEGYFISVFPFQAILLLFSSIVCLLFGTDWEEVRKYSVEELFK